MPRFPVSPYWSSNPNIPIYLDRSETPEEEKRESRAPAPAPVPAHPRHAPEYICPTCETSSRDTPIHCVSKSPSAASPALSPALSPAPPSYSSIIPIHPPPSPRHLTVPVLTVETPRHWSKPQAPHRSLQFDPEGRPHVRFRRNAFSPLSPTVTEFDEIDWSRKSQAGLGIDNAPFRPDSSPITPGTIEKRGEETSEDIERPSNWAQRIEQKLWNYTASRNVVKRWLIEIVSWSLSAACMAGIGVMLLFYHDKTIPKWPLGLTLNAYISVLAKVASASLLLPVSEALGQLKWSWFKGDNSKKLWDFEIFDNASRGPWGSFLLLVRTKGKTLAALGAAVTIFALALDPFFQQVVEYPEVWRLQPGKGHIPKAFKYFPFSSGFEYLAGSPSLELDQNMGSITYHYFYDNGLPPTQFGKGVRADVPLGCPSSNCTWPIYETMGIEAECAEVPDQLEFKCMKSNLDWVQNPILPESSDPYYFPNGTACGWWLKADKPVFMTGYDADGKGEHAGEVLLQRSEPLYDIFSRQFMPGYHPKLNNTRNPLAHVVIVSGQDLEHVYQNTTPIAHECTLSWAAKTMSSEYSEGGYSETVVKTRINSTVAGSPWQTTVIPNDDPLKVLYDYIYLEEVVIIGENDTTYRMDNDTHLRMVSLFDDIFPSYYTISNSTEESDAMLRYKRWKQITPLSRNMTYNPFLYANISTHLGKMATAMTNIIRSNTPDTEIVEGLAFDKESIVEVRWAWLTLPFALLVFTGIFLLATVFRSSREQDHVGVWKTSALATLFYGLPKDMTKKMTPPKEHGTPRAKAKEVKVKWIQNRGWRFSGNSISPTSVKIEASPTSVQSDTSSVLHKARQSPPVPSRWL